MSATPILDLWKDPPAPRANKWTTMIGLAVGALIGFALIEFGDYLPGSNLLVWIPCFYIAIALHEVGHLAAGKMNGMAPGFLAVGGFIMTKSGDHWNFRFDRRQIFGGMAGLLPEKGDVRVSAFAWMVAAGPIASVVLAIACWTAYAEFGSGTWDWIGSACWASTLGLLSLIPMSAGVHKSDAARFWMLIKQPAAARAWMAAGAVGAENARGVRPREWDSAMVEQMLAEVPDGSAKVVRELLAYYRLLDERNEPAAREHLENALAVSAKSGKAVRQALFMEAAEVNALMIGNATKARTWRERALKLRKPESMACVDGAIAMCEGRYDEAIRDIAAVRAFMVKRKLDSGLARFAHERLNDRERRCEEALHAVAAS